MLLSWPGKTRSIAVLAVIDPQVQLVYAIVPLEPGLGLALLINDEAPLRPKHDEVPFVAHLPDRRERSTDLGHLEGHNCLLILVSDGLERNLAQVGQALL